MKVMSIFGTRPEFTKLSPIIEEFDKVFDHKIVHTGQHFSYNMDQLFFKQLGIRAPDFHGALVSKEPIKQVSEMMSNIADAISAEKPDWVVVLGDTNSTLSGALAASKMKTKLIHLEAGCRSNNLEMPEEINRILVDHCSNLLLAPDSKAKDHLIRENISEDKIHVIGSSAIDACLRNVNYSKDELLEEYNLSKQNYALLTLHRAENTDNISILKGIVEAINEIASKIPLVIPLHPRTMNIMKINGIELSSQIKLIEPLGYLEFLTLLKNAYIVFSDSGGIQEEAAVLNIPCLILRNETEWTYLIDAGKNMLISNCKENIIKKTFQLLENPSILKNMREKKYNFKTNVSKIIIELIKSTNLI